jgi:uncharacterized membrane protein YagU involved in acid resistance
MEILGIGAMRQQAKATLWGGLVAGTIAASVINLVSPIIILQFIATGLLGKAALSGGLSAAALGLLLQWLMSLLIAGIYVAAANGIAWLRVWWIVSGPLYGVVIYLVMNFVDVPLSRAPMPHHPPHIEKILENLAAMILFGLIVAWFARGDITLPRT